MKLYRAGVTAGVLAAALALAACSSSGKTGGGSSTANDSSAAGTTSAATGGGDCSTGTLNAEGSTAQANAMTAWINAYTKECTGAKINYNPTGSGDGVSAFTAGQVDFAGSDSALKKDEGEVAAAQKQCGSAPLDLPMVVGPIAIAYKLNGVDKLTLTSELIAKIFTGKITKWNDPAIAAANSGASLPVTDINVVYRSDSSGTTENFEKYLSATDPTDFTAAPSKENAAQVFAGQGKAKSQGVAQGISATDGSIGYVEFSYAVQAGLSTAAVDNGGGAVDLSQDSASQALAAAQIVGTGSDLTLQLDYTTNAPGAYPIVLVTYEIVCAKYSDSATGTFVKNFLDYTANDGQALLAGLGYAPLPSDLQAKVNAAIASIG